MSLWWMCFFLENYPMRKMGDQRCEFRLKGFESHDVVCISCRNTTRTWKTKHEANGLDFAWITAHFSHYYHQVCILLDAAWLDADSITFAISFSCRIDSAMAIAKCTNSIDFFWFYTSHCHAQHSYKSKSSRFGGKIWQECCNRLAWNRLTTLNEWSEV